MSKPIEQERPYFGRTETEFQELSGFSIAYLPYLDWLHGLAKEKNAYQETTLIPNQLLREIRGMGTAEEIFKALKSRLQAVVELAIGDSEEHVSRFGKEIAKIFLEYVVALETTYEFAHHGPVSQSEASAAKLHRSSIEFFCHNLFGDELAVLRHALARHAPEVFLDLWEKLDENGKVVWNDNLPKMKDYPRKKKAATEE